MIKRVWPVALGIVLYSSPYAAAQSVATSVADRLRLGAHVSSVALSGFDESDLGIGGRVAWHPVALIGVEAEMTLYPRDYPDGRAFSSARNEGLFGVTVGPTFGRFRPFARGRAGFTRFQEAPQPFPCILIFPPPLQCSLASGATARAIDIGGGVEVTATRRTFLRVDAGDLLLTYPGPVFDNEGAAREKGFVSHNLRISAGGGFKF